MSFSFLHAAIKLTKYERLISQVSYAVELGSSVKAKGLSERLKNPERWLREKWIPAVKRARTLSSLHFCLCVLDCCLKWEECTLYLVSSLTDCGLIDLLQ